MADSTLNLTFTKLRIRVAEFLGMDFKGTNGDEAAQLPTDAHDLDVVGRMVNDGYARFIADNEKGWHFLTVPLSITFGTGEVGSDASRYYLPDDFTGILASPWTYGANGPLVRIEQVTEGRIRELHSATSSTTGDATVFAVRAINTTAAATTQRWEAIFWPTPTGTETITSTYKRYPQALANAGDTSVAGPIHDRTVLAAALAAAELYRDDRIGIHEQSYQAALVRSRKIDDRSRSSTVGDYGDHSEDTLGPRKRFSMNYDGEQVLP